MKEWIKKCLRGTKLHSWVLSLLNSHRPSEVENVFIFSQPRSGSTWLMEVIWSQPGFKYCNEPLNLKGKWLRENSGIAGFKELYSGKIDAKVINYFKRIVSGKSHFLDPNPLRKYYRFFTNRIVFKIIHGGEFLINDIANSCNGKVVYLLRNPIDVALSRKQITRVNELTSERAMKHFTNSQQELIQNTFKSGSAMEKKIVAWCIQTKLALLSFTSDWLVISYEEMVLEPKTTFIRVKDHCKLDSLDLMLNHVKTPSAVSVQSKAIDVDTMRGGDRERKNLVNKWKNCISKKEAIGYFSLCSKLGVPLYSLSQEVPAIKSLN